MLNFLWRLKQEKLGMKSKIIGITGSIATGKSTAASIIKELGYKVIDADKIAHKLMEKGQPNYETIVEHFGKEILSENQEIDRKKLGKIVFNDNDKLELLNSISHPNIFFKIKKDIENSTEEIVFVDIPILIELIKKKKLNIRLDEIWLVYVDRRTQIERLSKRNNISIVEAKNLVNNQISIEDKKKYADFIVDNSKDIDYLKYQIKEKSLVDLRTNKC